MYVSRLLEDCKEGLFLEDLIEQSWFCCGILNHHLRVKSQTTKESQNSDYNSLRGSKLKFQPLLRN